jgi:predicted metal-dependent HD superfamily phosphohydrolase
VYWSQSVGGDGYHSPAEEHIFEAIKASKNHCAMSNDALPHWAKNFLDYDLSGLAGLNYRDNGKKIWEEYKPFVSLDQFVEGRTKFLKGMLDAPQIYWNHPVWERQARRNMLDELMELHQGIYKFC